MNKYLQKIFSLKILAFLGLVFAAAIAVATFVEYKHGIPVSQFFIYDAWWFEILLAFIGLGSLINIFNPKLYARGKTGIVLFHLSISVIILGAGITRFIGETGTLRIRENASSNLLIVDNTEVRLEVFKKGDLVYEDRDIVYPNAFNQDYYKKKLQLNGNEITIESDLYAESDMQYPVTKFVLASGEKAAIAFINHFQYDDTTAIEFEGYQFKLSVGNELKELPFTLMLDSFVVERYPGSTSPSSFSSYVKVIDPQEYEEFSFNIYMNHILKYRGYRFFQASYDQDELGTVLSVNHDPLGSGITYFGYFLLVLGMLKALTDRRSRFIKYLGKVRNPHILLLALLLSSFTLSIKAEVNAETAKRFGELWVQTNDGRIKPMNTFAGDLLRKISRKSEEKNRKAEAVILDILKDPASNAARPYIYKSETGIPFLDSNPSKRIAYNDLFTESGNYVLQNVVQNIYRKKPADRSKTENNILAIDERANIFNMLRQGHLINLFPMPNKASEPWVDLRMVPQVFMSGDSLTKQVFSTFYLNFFSDDSEDFNKAAEFVDNWQKQFAPDVLPADGMRKIELTLNKLNVFERLSRFYSIISLIFLIAAIISQVNRNKIATWLAKVMGIHLIVAAVFHGVGLLLRGLVSGHIPVSNGYETMIFISWIAILIGIYFYKKSDITFALLGLLASSALMVAHLSFMNPQITPLVPVLKSVWLNIHVTVITSSYAFLGGSAMIALTTLLFMALLTEKNAPRIAVAIRKLIAINRMIMIPGLYLLTIGCFLGGVWANQSWGKYWGWDPKETWSLVSIVIYSFVAHLHHMPGLKGSFFYVAGSLLSFSSILMTYFGVNYFLGGMHSYAGDGTLYSLPSWVYYVLISLGILLLWAYKRYKKVLAGDNC